MRIKFTNIKQLVFAEQGFYNDQIAWPFIECYTFIDNDIQTTFSRVDFSKKWRIGQILNGSSAPTIILQNPYSPVKTPYIMLRDYVACDGFLFRAKGNTNCLRLHGWGLNLRHFLIIIFGTSGYSLNIREVVDYHGPISISTAATGVQREQFSRHWRTAPPGTRGA
jgi:hypothetical protein